MEFIELAVSGFRFFGQLVAGDVFVQDGVELEKLANGRAYSPAGNVEIVINDGAIVEYYGFKIWPSDERLEEVMSSE